MHRTVGRALVLSTIALIVGFLALCSSEFVPTIYFGALVGCCLAGGLLGNLVMLPLLLGVAFRDEGDQERGRSRGGAEAQR